MRVAGYAAIFDRVDAGGDVVRRGAFAGARLPLPLLLEHDPIRRIGTVVALREDERGLWVEACVAAHGIARIGVRRGLSFGYRVGAVEAVPPPTQLQVNDAPHRSGQAGGLIDLQLASGREVSRTNRELTCVSLIELSVVARPMQAGARVVWFQ